MISITADNIANLLVHAYRAFPSNKIEQIKFVRSILGTGLKVSKDLMDAEHKRRQPVADFNATIERALKSEGEFRTGEY